MRLAEDACARAMLLAVAVCGAVWGGAPARGTFSVTGGECANWTRILRSMGLLEAAPIGTSGVAVYTSGGPGDVAAAMAAIESGTVAILEGDSLLARRLGIVPANGRIEVRRVRDIHDRKLRIEWKDAVEVPVFRVPGGSRIFTTAWTGHAPLVVGLKQGRGAALWVAVSPGDEGYERFPYLPQALADLGVESRLVSRRLWAFFDPGVHGPLGDPDRLAARWRQSGIAAVQIAVWDFFEGEPRQDEYLRRVIEACHRHLILAYAWLELPHVSRTFWDDHPEWREKTALGKEAKLDWRWLMNLADPDCEREVRRGVRDLTMRLDWDGVNLAELYFDGTQGLGNLAEFTPLNDSVRRAFREAHGFDPMELFRSPAATDRMRTFLEYRVELAARLEARWVDALEEVRASKPGLDLVLTHVDDLFDASMRDALGADAGRAARLLDNHAMTMLVEDPATLWHLGPRRYAEIARRYAALPAAMERVGVDVNVVQREQKAFPTAAQTGVELLQIIRTAAENFSRVAYYCEATIDAGDLPFLPAASAVVTAWREQGGRATVESPWGVGIRWKGPAAVDGEVWPVQDGEVVWVPPGRHELQAAAGATPALVADFNGTIERARVVPQGLEIGYRSDARALALLSRKPERLTVDGAGAALEGFDAPQGRFIAALPRGAHRTVLHFGSAER